MMRRAESRVREDADRRRGSAMTLRMFSAAAMLAAIAAFSGAPAMAGCDLTDPACAASGKGEGKKDSAETKSIETPATAQ